MVRRAQPFLALDGRRSKTNGAHVRLLSLQALTTIVATDNRIAKIDPAGLQRLKGLACLDLTNNNLSEVSHSIPQVCPLPVRLMTWEERGGGGQCAV